MTSIPSVFPDEIVGFSAQAGEWWKKRGAFRALHEMGPLRLRYIKEQVGKPLKGLRILDVGCGGGLMAEPLAREGARVTGIDASPEAVAVAQAHALQEGLEIDYRLATAEDLARGAERFDLIVALEIVEHIANREAFMEALAGLLTPGGTIIVATLNRTKRSFLLSVVAAEYLLGWIPPGTHDWNAFVRPCEMVSLWEKRGIKAIDCTGVVFRPLARRFELCRGRTAVNYFMAGRKEKPARNP